MKLNLGQITLGFVALQRIGMDKMPIKVAYNIQRNMRLLKPEAEGREEKRIELVKSRFGKEGKDGDFQVPPSKMDAFLKQVKELDEVEVELDIHTISFDDFKGEIAPNDLFALEWMFTEPPKEELKKKNKNGKGPNIIPPLP